MATFRSILACLVLNVAAGSIAAPPIDGHLVKFKRVQLDDKFRSEGVAVGDFNHDGRSDIAVGRVWYSAPDWEKHTLLSPVPELDLQRWSDSFLCFSDDLNGDGWTDLIVVDFPGRQTWWLENPKAAAESWRRWECTPVTNNESPQYLDVDGDGRRELLAAFIQRSEPSAQKSAIGLLHRPADSHEPWSVEPISASGAPGTGSFSHGLGAGDINGDGRQDVLVPEGWWEAPAKAESAPWKFHPIEFNKPVAQMIVYDFDGDGDADIACSSAHDIGIWWLEQTSDGWKTHEIDTSFSQSHSLCMADINSDGLSDLITGKRFWAHGRNGDVQPNHPAVLYWFELKRENGKPIWIPHEIDHDSGVGTQFEVADVNADGLLDVVTSNKKGVFYFEQRRLP